MVKPTVLATEIQGYVTAKQGRNYCAFSWRNEYEVLCALYVQYILQAKMANIREHGSARAWQRPGSKEVYFWHEIEHCWNYSRRYSEIGAAYEVMQSSLARAMTAAPTQKSLFP